MTGYIRKWPKKIAEKKIENPDFRGDVSTKSMGFHQERGVAQVAASNRKIQMEDKNGKVVQVSLVELLFLV